WNLNDVTNLKLRLRTPCEDGSEWCDQNNRIQYNIQLPVPQVDDSSIVATWTMEVNKGTANYNSSKGDPNNFTFLPCQRGSINCRFALLHSEVKEFRLTNGYYTALGLPFLNIISLGEFNGLRLINLATNLP